MIQYLNEEQRKKFYGLSSKLRAHWAHPISVEGSKTLALDILGYLQEDKLGKRRRKQLDRDRAAYKLNPLP